MSRMDKLKGAQKARLESPSNNTTVSKDLVDHILEQQDSPINIPEQKSELTNIPDVSANKEKKSVGRKSLSPDKKKSQIAITIKSSSLSALMSVDEDDYRKLLSRYIDKHIEDIVEELKTIY